MMGNNCFPHAVLESKEGVVGPLVRAFQFLQEDLEFKKQGYSRVCHLDPILGDRRYEPIFGMYRVIFNKQKCADVWGCPVSDSEEELYDFIIWLDKIVKDFGFEDRPLLKMYPYLEAFYQLVSLGGSNSVYIGVAETMVYVYSSSIAYYAVVCKKKRINPLESHAFPCLAEEFQNLLHLKLCLREMRF